MTSRISPRAMENKVVTSILLLSFASWTKSEKEKLVAPYQLVTPNSTDISFEEPHILATWEWAEKLKIKRENAHTDFSGPVLKVGCFHYPPFTFKTELENGTFGYRGVEVSLVSEIASSLGLAPEFHSPRDGTAWGTVYKNGSVDGLFGDIVEGVVDVGMAEYFYYPGRIAISLPSEFYIMEHFCFTRMKPAPVPRWQALLRPFEVVAWGATFLSLMVKILFLILNRSLGGSLSMSGGEMVLSSIAFIIGQSLGWRKERFFFKNS